MYKNTKTRKITAALFLAAALFFAGCNKTNNAPPEKSVSVTASKTAGTVTETSATDSMGIATEGTTASVTEAAESYVYFRDDSVETPLSERGYGGFFGGFAVRGGYIYYIQNDSPAEDWRYWYDHIWRVSLDGSERRRVSPAGDGIKEFYIDGERIFYDAYAKDRNRICKINLDGADYERMYDVSSSGSGYGAASTVYTRGYYYFTDWETCEIFRINVKSGRRERIDGILTLNLGRCVNGFVYAQNSRDSWGNMTYTDTSLYRIDGGGVKPTKLGEKFSELDIVWSTDDWIYYRDYEETRNGGTKLKIRRVSVDGAADEAVANLDGYDDLLYDRGGLYDYGGLHTTKDGNHYFYNTISEETATDEEFVSERAVKFVRYSVSDDATEEIGQFTYRTYYMDDGYLGYYGYLPPEEEWYKYNVSLYYDVYDGYIYFNNPDPDEYGKVYRLSTDGSGKIEFVAILKD
jgi:hypothetical protein